MEQIKIKISDLAKQLNTNNKRIMEKLAEIKIIPKSAQSSLTDDELKEFYSHIGYKPSAAKSASDDSSSDASDKQKVAKSPSNNAGTQRTGSVVLRRIVYDDSKNQGQGQNQNQTKQNTNPYSANNVSSNKNMQKKPQKSYNQEASSGLRQGFEVRSNENYDELIHTTKSDTHHTEGHNANKTETVQSDKPVVRFSKSTDEKNNKFAIIKKADSEEKIVEPEVNEIKTVETKVELKAEPAKDNEIEKETPVEQIKVSTDNNEKKIVEPVQTVAINETEKKEDAIILQKVEEVQPVTTQKVDEIPQAPQQRQGSYDRNNQSRPNSDRPRQDRPSYQGSSSSGSRPPYQGSSSSGSRPPYQGSSSSGSRPPYQGSSSTGSRPPYQGSSSSGSRPPYQPRTEGGYRPSPNKDGQSRPPYGQRDQGDKKPYNSQNRDNRSGGQARSSSSSLPGLEPIVTVIPEARKEPSINKSFDRVNKKDLKKESARPIPQSNKEKYNTAQNLIGIKKGVSEVMSDEFVIADHIAPVIKRSPKPKRDNRRYGGYNKQVSAPHIIAVLTNVTLQEVMSVKELAETLKKTSAEVIKKLMIMGIMANQNQEVDFDTAAIIAGEFGITAEKAVVVSAEEILFDDDEEADSNDPDAVERPPVVVVMGHVDHGKTSLLDAIRSTTVTAGEAGGITQHIGASKVVINGRTITFLDTPGHEAFTAMRARGAQVTDVAVLVVAADDGVMPQTVEAINHAKAAKVSLIVAVNKIDKVGANIEKVKQELAEYGVISEEWGGDAIFVPVSAKKHENIETLLETILLSADILGLKANPNKQAKGTVIEAKLDKNKGPVATVLVQRGTLKPGDSIVSGSTFGKIRTMVDDKGRTIKSAGPSTPVEITGLPEVPEAGEIFYCVTDEKLAKQLIEKRKNQLREKSLHASSKVSLDQLYSQIKAGKIKDLNIIIKADVQGSVEAVKQSLEKLSNEEVKIQVIHDAVGAITESDVTLAQVSNALIIGFNVRPGTGIAENADRAGVDIKLYSIIYDAIADIKAAMLGMLEPEYQEIVIGHTLVRQTFKASGVGTIAGCYVTDGRIVRNSTIRVIRDGVVVFTGKLGSLKRFKDDAKEVAAGFECGLSIEKYNDLKEGDIVEAFTMEAVARK